MRRDLRPVARRGPGLTVADRREKSRAMALRFADHEFAALPELRWHPEAKRIRALVDGAAVVDSTRARIVWEPRRVVPSFAVPVDDIDGSLVAAEPDTAEEQAVQLGDGPPVLDPSTGFTFHSVEGRPSTSSPAPRRCPRRRSRPPMQISTATSSWTSTPSTSGVRRTRCSSATPATRSRRSTRDAAPAASRSRSPV